MPEGTDARNAAEWRKFLQRTLNFYYRAAAVEMVKIGGKGRGFYEWEVMLYESNDPQWLASHLKQLVLGIRKQIHQARSDGLIMERLMISSPGQESTSWPLRRHAHWLS